MTEYLFAYGSLIGSPPPSGGEGRLNIPVKVAGLKRGWYLPVPEDGNTGLGAVFRHGAVCNGVLIWADERHLAGTDEREKQHGYHRALLTAGDISPLDGRQLELDKIWVYLAAEISLPTARCPIAQSYLDVVLSGCLGISEEFAEEFILTTDGWDAMWINDRQRPRYRRAITADSARIDDLLRKVIPGQLARRIDSG